MPTDQREGKLNSNQLETWKGLQVIFPQNKLHEQHPQRLIQITGTLRENQSLLGELLLNTHTHTHTHTHIYIYIYIYIYMCVCVCVCVYVWCVVYVLFRLFICMKSNNLNLSSHEQISSSKNVCTNKIHCFLWNILKYLNFKESNNLYSCVIWL